MALTAGLCLAHSSPSWTSVLQLSPRGLCERLGSSGPRSRPAVRGDSGCRDDTEGTGSEAAQRVKDGPSCGGHGGADAGLSDHAGRWPCHSPGLSSSAPHAGGGHSLRAGLREACHPAPALPVPLPRSWEVVASASVC